MSQIDSDQRLKQVFRPAFLICVTEFFNIFGDDRGQREIIYHYTNSAGLRGIIESKTLWATNLSFVNDSEELEYGLSIIKQRAILENERRTGENCAPMLTSLIDLLGSTNTAKSYACSFSIEGDQLSQWRGYTSNTLGYSLGFARNGLGYRKLQHHMLPVLYAPEKQAEFAKFVVDTYLDVYCQNQARLDLSYTRVLVAEYLVHEVEFWSVVFKHQGFWEEQEIRIMVRNDEAEHIKIREKNGIFVPYVEIKLPNSTELPLTEIIIGPTDHYERAKAGLRALLDNNGFDHVTIRPSEIPYRSQ